MQHYFLNRSQVEIGEHVRLNQEDSHHFLRVLRAQLGDQVTLATTDGLSYLAELTDSQADEARLIILRIEKENVHSVELPVNVTIACGLSKNDKIEMIVQKATECGMSEFMPLALKRDVVKWVGKKADAKIDRLGKIAKGAAEQSHRLVVPKITSLHNLEQLLEASSAYDVKLIAYEETAKEGEHSQLAKVLQSLPTKESKPSILIVFGSEGGLEKSEVLRLEEAGFVACSLGPRILRAETAPIYFLSALSFALELDTVD